MLPEGIYLFSKGLDKVAKPFPTEVESLPENWRTFPDFAEGTAVEHEDLAFFRFDAPVSFPTFICGECTSTMDVAAELIRRGLLPEWGSVLALSQNSGRGQLRRPWTSPAGNLYATLRWPELSGGWKAVDVGLVSIVFGWCFMEAASSMGANLLLKWPNDLLQNGRKVAGMLMEDRFGATLGGIGMNLVHSPGDDDMRRDAACPAGKLAFGGAVHSVPNLWSNLENQAKNIYARLICDFSPQEFLSLVESRLAWVGRNVLVRDGGEPATEGRLSGLSEDGGLIVGRNGVESVVRSGSIVPV